MGTPIHAAGVRIWQASVQSVQWLWSPRSVLIVMVKDNQQATQPENKDAD
jgi:hypothetical protein